MPPSTQLASATRSGWLADAGYWSEDNATAQGPDRLIATLKDHKQRRAARELGITTGPPPDGSSVLDAMEHRLRTTDGAPEYAKRSHTVEPVFGDHKENRGFRRFRRRGLAAVRSEWALINLSHNVDPDTGATSTPGLLALPDAGQFCDSLRGRFSPRAQDSQCVATGLQHVIGYARGGTRGPPPRPRGWQTDDVPRKAATVKLDDEVFTAVRREAERSGRSEDQVVEAAVRRYIGPSVLDRLRERNRVGEDEAMAIALEEVAARRQERRSG